MIIHESRFTFQQAGFEAVVDLGAWWEEQTGLPIPLGCIAAHQRVPLDVGAQFEALIRRSIALAREKPERALPYIRSHSQELTEEVLRAHIDMFVNDFTIDLGEAGRRMVQVLQNKAQQAGILP